MALALILAGAPGARAQGLVERWSILTTAREVHSDNLFLASDGPGDIMDSLFLRLLYSRATPRSTLSVSGFGSGTLFRDFSTYSQGQYGLGLGGSRRLSRRVLWTVGGAASSGMSLESLYGTRIQLPQISVVNAHATSALVFELGSATNATADFTGSWTRFRAEQRVEGGMLTFNPLLADTALLPRLEDELVPGVPGPVDGSFLLLNILASEGLLDFESEALVYNGGLSLMHALTPRVSATGGVHYGRIRLRPHANLTGGRTDAQIGMRALLATSGGLSLNYAYHRNEAQVPRVDSHDMLASADRTFGRYVKIDGSVGVSRFEAPGVGSPGTVVLGGAGLNVRGRRTIFDARYNRSTYLALGFGRNQATDIASATLSQALTKRLSMALLARYRYSEDVLDDSFSVRMQIYSTALRYRIKRRTEVGTDYTFRRLTGGSFPAVASNLWSVFITYGRVWE